MNPFAKPHEHSEEREEEKNLAIKAEQEAKAALMERTAKARQILVEHGNMESNIPITSEYWKLRA